MGKAGVSSIAVISMSCCIGYEGSAPISCLRLPRAWGSSCVIIPLPNEITASGLAAQVAATSPVRTKPSERVTAQTRTFAPEGLARGGPPHRGQAPFCQPAALKLAGDH